MTESHRHHEVKSPPGFRSDVARAVARAARDADQTILAISDALPLLSINAERAARKIVEACRRGAPRLTIGVQTKAAILLNELFPSTSGLLAALVNRVLPDADPSGSKTLYSGWESQSSLAPSWLTRLSDLATTHNNEGRT